MTHAIGFGLIFVKHLVPVLESLLILANGSMLIVMVLMVEELDRNSLFGVKVIFGVSLLYLRLETVRIQLKVLRRPSSQKIQPEMNNMNQSERSVGFVSVQEKVISELRHVQGRVDHDARADVALEYCIKMISTNQLNEQDFEMSNEESSSGDESVSSLSEKGAGSRSQH